MRYRMKRGKILFHDLQLERMHDERFKCNVARFVSGERCLQLASTSLVSFMSLKIFQGDIFSGLMGSTYWTVGVAGEMSILVEPRVIHKKCNRDHLLYPGFRVQ